WLVWQLTGHEVRSLGFAAYKAQYSEAEGYPQGMVPGLSERLSVPHRIGSSGGSLSEAWRTRTGISGRAIVAVAVIDYHGVPLADSNLSGLLLGLTTETTGVGIYRALIESLCFGARTVVDLFEAGDFAINHVILTSGLAQNNPLLVQIMADVLGRVVEVPSI